MEVTICVPLGADISAVKAEYPDIYQDEGWDDHDRYFVGKSDDGLSGAEAREARSFLTYSQAVQCCGFCEGAVEGCNTLIEGNGPWAQGLLGLLDFSGYAMSEKEKRARMRSSRMWLAANKRGSALALNPQPKGAAQ